MEDEEDDEEEGAEEESHFVVEWKMKMKMRKKEEGSELKSDCFVFTCCIVCLFV